MNAMERWSFERVTARAQKAGPCTVCGRRAVRKTTFGQTLNPFNRNAEGAVKTRQEILRELRDEVLTWEAEPVTHVRCGGAP